MSTEAIMLGVPPTTEKFAEKLAHLLEMRRWKQTDLAAELKISPQLVHQYLKGSIPKPHTLVLIGKALNADLAWLCDESIEATEAPPPFKSQQRLQDVPARDLMMEVGRRYLIEAVDLASMIGAQEAIHEKTESPETAYPDEDRPDAVAVRIWTAVWKEGTAHRVSLPDEAEAQDVWEIGQKLMLLSNIGDMIRHALAYLSTVPPQSHMHAYDPRELHLPNLLKQWAALTEAHPGYDMLGRYTQSRDVLRSKSDAVCRHMGGAALAYLLTRPQLAKIAAYDALRSELKKAGQIDAKGEPVFYAGDARSGNINVPKSLLAKTK